jgi:hypothetical protein
MSSGRDRPDATPGDSEGPTRQEAGPAKEQGGQATRFLADGAAPEELGVKIDLRIFGDKVVGAMIFGNTGGRRIRSTAVTGRDTTRHLRACCAVRGWIFIGNVRTW